MTECQVRIEYWSVIWLVSALLVGYVGLNKRAPPLAGLTFVYMIAFMAIHFIPGVTNLLPWHNDKVTKTDEAGMAQSAFGAAAFAVGVVLSVAFGNRMHRRAMARFREQIRTMRCKYGRKRFQDFMERDTAWAYHSLVYLDKLSVRYTCWGVLFFIGQEFIPSIPSTQGIVSMIGYLTVVGICLGCWRSWFLQKRSTLVKWLLFSCTLPFGVMILKGMMSYGVMMLLMVWMFVANFYRPRWKLISASILGAYILMSVYVVYMEWRTVIRSKAWDNAPVTERIVAAMPMVTEFELFDPFNEKHLHHVDDRLDQNFLVGAAVFQLEKSQDFAMGETLMDSVAGLVPRALWPNKPVNAGSGLLVTRFTGIEFAEGISVGMGQVFELYVNYGSGGVMIGFLILGVVLAALDRSAGVALRTGKWGRFILYYLPGIGMLQPQGSFFEMTGSMASAIIVATVLSYTINVKSPHRRRKISQISEPVSP